MPRRGARYPVFKGGKHGRYQFNRPKQPITAVSICLATFYAGPISAVSARDLHTFLRVGKDFSTWIKAQVSRARLLEHQDFEILATPPQGGAGNRGMRTEYLLTLKAARHLALISETVRGHGLRALNANP